MNGILQTRFFCFEVVKMSNLVMHDERELSREELACAAWIAPRMDLDKTVQTVVGLVELYQGWSKDAFLSYAITNKVLKPGSQSGVMISNQHGRACVLIEEKDPLRQQVIVNVIQRFLATPPEAWIQPDWSVEFEQAAVPFEQ